MMAEVPASPGGGSHDESGDQSPRSNFREQDRYLPIANISRIMKKVLPAIGMIAKDARETVQECVSEFISFITSEASDKCQREKRKKINGDDLLWAMATLGFEDYIAPLKIYLSGYREVDQKLCSRHFNLYKFAVAYPPVSSSSERLMLSSSFFPRSNSSHGLDRVKQMEGDTKGSVKGGDSSARKDASGAQHGPNAQIAHQGSFSRGIGYPSSQAQHMMVPMQANRVDMSSYNS